MNDDARNEAIPIHKNKAPGLDEIGDYAEHLLRIKYPGLLSIQAFNASMVTHPNSQVEQVKWSNATPEEAAWNADILAITRINNALIIGIHHRRSTESLTYIATNDRLSTEDSEDPKIDSRIITIGVELTNNIRPVPPVRQGKNGAYYQDFQEQFYTALEVLSVEHALQPEERVA